MRRIPYHTVSTAPEASQPMLEALLDHGGPGRLLNLQAQLAHSPTTLGAYLAIRTSIQEHATLEPAIRFAIQLAVSVANNCEYSEAVNTMLLLRAGVSPSDIGAIRDGEAPRDKRLAALLAVAREAAGNGGSVADVTWSAALSAGWTDADLAETFACIGLTLFVDYFIAYAQTANDVPSPQPGAGS